MASFLGALCRILMLECPPAEPSGMDFSNALLNIYPFNNIPKDNQPCPGKSLAFEDMVTMSVPSCGMVPSTQSTTAYWWLFSCICYVKKALAACQKFSSIDTKNS